MPVTHERAHPLTEAALATEEGGRIASRNPAWRKWGPYVGARQWGSVREDYSADGDAWAYFPHDHARSRAYRWGEDGIGGFCDDQQRLVLSLALWNERDRILKERFFGLTNAEGNHGEDAKELWYLVDATPTHAYMRMVYKYPQRAFPYDELIEQNRARTLDEREFEITDTDAFADGRYFDVQIEYAKALPDDMLLRVTATNRGPETARLHLLPQLVARNTWAWDGDRPKARLVAEGDTVVAEADGLTTMRLVCDGTPDLLFCENETNVKRLYGVEHPGPFKDGFNDFVVDGDAHAIASSRSGTKAAAHYVFDVRAGEAVTVRVRLVNAAAEPSAAGFADFDALVAKRRAEADAFFAVLQDGMTDDERLVHRQALAGLLWSKQFYAYEVRRWLTGDPAQPAPPAGHASIRNTGWRHMVLFDVISMPDDWEYPWFASWDLAFQCIALASVDPDFAKDQLILLLQARAQHPNGMLPGFEWDFDAANPPVHAFAALQIFDFDRTLTGVPDFEFLERVFHKLLLNFTWWVNREDATGRNVFQGGFLGLDNIALFDRSVPLEDGATIDQSDATAWMAMYALNCMRIALELAIHDDVYEDLATKFFEHFLHIAEAAHAMVGEGATGLWDDDDGFYYDVLQHDGARPQALRVRSLVGLIPLLAVEVMREEALRVLPRFSERSLWFLEHRPELASLVSRWTETGGGEVGLLSLMRRERMNRVLARMLDEKEFLSDYGIRSVSKHHLEHPYTLDQKDRTLTIAYEPGEGRTRLFGGNSNWRGPIWMPLNYMLIAALRRFHSFYGDAHRIDFPTGSGDKHTLDEIADLLADRVKRLFLADADGRRAFRGDSVLEQEDPHFRDLLLFHEYFHGDTGRGLGASHQTGWTALVATLLQPKTHPTPATAATPPMSTP